MRKYKSLKGLRKAIAEKRVKGVLSIDNDNVSFNAINPKDPDGYAVEIYNGGVPGRMCDGLTTSTEELYSQESAICDCGFTNKAECNQGFCVEKMP